MPRLRILVLTSSTGGGHDAAEALAEWCFQLYRHDIDVRIEQMLEKSSVIHRGGVGLYNYLQRRAPWVHNFFYAIVELLSYLNRRSVVLGAGYYARVLREYQPHLVFSVHDCLNRGYFQLARKLLGADRVRCATYCGEFSGGWGYSRNWIEPTVDLTSPAPRRPRLRREMGIRRADPRPRQPDAPRSRLRCSAGAGIPAGKPADRRFTVFLATGGKAPTTAVLLPALCRRWGSSSAAGTRKRTTSSFTGAPPTRNLPATPRVIRNPSICSSRSATPS